MSNLRQRVISGIILALLVGGLTIVGGVPFTVLMTLISALILHEWIGMVENGSDDRLFLVGTICLALLGLAILFLGGSAMFLAAVLILAIGAGLFFTLGATALTVFGLFYAALTLLSMAHLRGDSHFTPGLIAILFVYAVVWTTDIAAYFVGRAIGGPKLAPRISPGKTLSGAIGGLVFGVIAALLLSAAADLRHLWQLAFLAVLISVASQAGDLFESSLKRRSGVKDSSNLIPGHGGVMDRMDGLVFGAILLWLASVMSAGFHRPALAFFA